MSKLISIPVSYVGSHIVSGDGSTSTFPRGTVVYNNVSGTTYAYMMIASGTFGNATSIPTTTSTNTVLTYGTSNNLVSMGPVFTRKTWVSGTTYNVGDIITNATSASDSTSSGNTYIVTTAGSSTTGPTNTSGSSGALAGGSLVVSYISASTAWVSGVSYSVNTIITHAGNMYIVTTAGSSTAAPTNTSGSSGALTGGSLVVSFLSKATVSGTQWTASTTLAANSTVYWAGNVYNTTTGGNTDAATPPTHTSGNVTNGTAALRFLASYFSPGTPWMSGVSYPQYSLVYYGNIVYVVTAAGSSTVPPSGFYSQTVGTLSLVPYCNIGRNIIVGLDKIITAQSNSTSYYETQIKYLNDQGTVSTVNINSIYPDSTYAFQKQIMSQIGFAGSNTNAGNAGVYTIPSMYSAYPSPNMVSGVAIF